MSSRDKKRISLLFLTRYNRKGASSRYRFYQFFPILEAEGFSCHVFPFFDDIYLDHLYGKGRRKALDIIRAYIKRVITLFKVGIYDLVIIEKELFPYMPATGERILKFLGIKYVVDYDDAVHIQYIRNKNRIVRSLLKRKIEVVMRNADMVITGNRYLAEYAMQAKAERVEVFPTVVDMNRYPLCDSIKGYSYFRICWIGTPKTAAYLQPVIPVLREFQKGRKIKLVVIGGIVDQSSGVPMEVLPWSEDTEVHDMQNCDVGIMPLSSSEWENGKCGLKLIQYMASGLPVIASPAGVNSDIVENGRNGFIARNRDEWVTALSILYEDTALRRTMGNAGRIMAEDKFSLRYAGPRFKEFIIEALGR